jgi:hypothetical protein
MIHGKRITTGMPMAKSKYKSLIVFVDGKAGSHIPKKKRKYSSALQLLPELGLPFGHFIKVDQCKLTPSAALVNGW